MGWVLSRHCERAKRAWQNKRSEVSLENKRSRVFFSNPKSNTIDAENGLPRLDFVKSRNDGVVDCHASLATCSQ
ncbi:hypothetical protein [Helicobacter macacae]|uniref:Uncharacterized protein n=1 Tax=Helicobacter macacae MIT 99-5501 TaxID=1357400 RepID=V8C9F6_9HELI|nr:hypothetical protein [Helicobacter macacae]ETD24033.1 hypothetical protein HMPREF2086_00780 [Helicobacter macacae MIT 99-5501]